MWPDDVHNYIGHVMGYDWVMWHVMWPDPMNTNSTVYVLGLGGQVWLLLLCGRGVSVGERLVWGRD